MNTGKRDLYLDALRASALLVVVFGHWLATLPRMHDGLMVGTEHLLDVWNLAGLLTWFVQVVPLFVFVSAAVSTEGASRRLHQGDRQLHWWAGRALGLARPTATYIAAIAALALFSLYAGGRFVGPLNQSLTVHLWFLIMLLTVQALLPASVEADRRFGLAAVFGLIIIALVVDLVRAGLPGPAGLLEMGERVMANASSPGAAVGWINAFAVWLLPQQLGIAWKRGRFRGAGMGALLMLIGLAWLGATVASGYPTAMVGFDLDGKSNMLPPTLALIGVMWVQVGAVLLFEKPARWLLDREHISGAVGLLGALGMPLYLWHKLAELPAAWLGERLDLPIDAGVPGSAGFWQGRLWWIALCIVMVIPVIAAVVGFEMSRRRDVPAATSTAAILTGGAALFAGLTVSMLLGAMPGALIGIVLILAASRLLRDKLRQG
ncbi:MAG: acyltransferase family protein [Wenzhouxiangellaceae bacterium]|nr:acyltransferase family protein [Wenzhouxiangellaceae bacterium]